MKHHVTQITIAVDPSTWILHLLARMDGRKRCIRAGDKRSTT